MTTDLKKFLSTFNFSNQIHEDNKRIKQKLQEYLSHKDNNKLLIRELELNNKKLGKELIGISANIFETCFVKYPKGGQEFINYYKELFPETVSVYLLTLYQEKELIVPDKYKYLFT